MKKQDILYKQAFEPLSKEEKLRTFYQFSGIVFADSIAMFEVITPKTESNGSSICENNKNLLWKKC